MNGLRHERKEKIENVLKIVCEFDPIGSKPLLPVLIIVKKIDWINVEDMTAAKAAAPTSNKNTSQ